MLFLAKTCWCKLGPEQVFTLPVYLECYPYVCLGKTLAFLLPCIETIAKNTTRKGISALILAPTRELALQVWFYIFAHTLRLTISFQIQAEAVPLAAQHGVRVACVFGGGAKWVYLTAPIVFSFTFIQSGATGKVVGFLRYPCGYPRPSG